MTIIRRPDAKDRDSWDRLYAGYAHFYKVKQTDEMRDRVWSWIRDPAHMSEGLVAEQQGELVGLAHFRPFARPLAASTGCFLDDLFVDPAARGSGAVEALIEALTEVARQREWTLIRWITAEGNFRARAVYDRMAQRKDWVTYNLNPLQ